MFSLITLRSGDQLSKRSDECDRARRHHPETSKPRASRRARATVDENGRDWLELMEDADQVVDRRTMRPLGDWLSLVIHYATRIGIRPKSLRPPGRDRPADSRRASDDLAGLTARCPHGQPAAWL